MPYEQKLHFSRLKNLLYITENKIFQNETKNEKSKELGYQNCNNLA